MAIHDSSTPIKLSEIQTEFGGSNPISLSEYYQDATPDLVPDTSANSTVPSIGSPISLGDFYNTVLGALMTTDGTLNGITGQVKEAVVSDYIDSNETLIIPSGFWLWSDSISTPALLIDIPCTVDLESNVNILGKGGRGQDYTGIGGYKAYEDGGDAIEIKAGVSGVTINTSTGCTIAGGGGGGISGSGSGFGAGGGGGAGGGRGGDGLYHQNYVATIIPGGAGGVIGTPAMDFNNGDSGGAYFAGWQVSGIPGPSSGAWSNPNAGGSGGGHRDSATPGYGAGGGGSGGGMWPYPQHDAAGGWTNGGDGGRYGTPNHSGDNLGGQGGGGWGAAGRGLSGFTAGAGGAAINDNGETYTLNRPGSGDYVWGTT